VTRAPFACAPSCGKTFDERVEYLEHLATCRRVLPAISAYAKRQLALPPPMSSTRSNDELTP
jgi:hypothetical protein